MYVQVMVTLTLCGMMEANMARTPMLVCQRLEVRLLRLYSWNDVMHHHYAVLPLLRTP
jgi:hypothetical protein